MKSLALFVGGTTLLLLSFSRCSNSKENQNSISSISIADNADTLDTLNLSVMQEEVEDRIQENIEIIETGVEKLTEKIKDQKNHLSNEALSRSSVLRQDLERLKFSLEKTMDSLDEVSLEVLEKNSEEVQSDLEQTEDEIAQIHQELEEWYDNYKD